MKLSNKFFTLLMSLLSLNAYAQTQQETKKYKCEIEFALGKYNIDHKKQVERCLNNVPEKEYIKLIHIISSANQIGNVKNNKILAQKRLDSARALLNEQPERFQTAITEEISVGRNHALGKKVYILILTTEKPLPEIRTVEKVIEKKVIVKKEVPVEVKKAISDYQFFINSRIARDIYMKYEIAPYFSYGLIGGINIQKHKHIKYELALSANQLVNDNVYAISNTYGSAGIHFISGKQEGFFAGLRGLSGIVLNQKDQADFDGGGEARIGYETQNFSFGFGAGRTRYTSRFGFEVGFKF